MFVILFIQNAVTLREKNHISLHYEWRSREREKDLKKYVYNMPNGFDASSYMRIAKSRACILTIRFWTTKSISEQRRAIDCYQT